MHQKQIPCPFCSDGMIEIKSGKRSCPDCGAKFEIDDREECIFVDINDPRLPVNGNFCSSCGLIQHRDNLDCVYCGRGLNTGVQ